MLKQNRKQSSIQRSFKNTWHQAKTNISPAVNVPPKLASNWDKYEEDLSDDCNEDDVTHIPFARDLL